MSSIQEQIEKIEKEIRETPYHKATEHHIGKLRAKLSKLKAQIQDTQLKGKGGGGGYAVKKQGDATAVLIGPPSVGKSTLLNKLTNAQSKIAPYEFTTVSVIPGMMDFQDARIQILDVPGLIGGAEKGKGRGREVLSVARAADLLLIMCDVDRVGLFEHIVESLEKAGIRVNQAPPNVAIEKKVKGGIIIHSNFKQDLGRQTIKGVAGELGIKNAEITIKEKLTLERLIDAFSQNRIYLPAIFVVNKEDLDKKLKTKSKDLQAIFISAEKGTGLDKLRQKIWKKLQFVRVYLVKRQEKPSKGNPIIMKEGQTLKELSEKIGSEFAEDKKKAKIWGNGSKYPGQEVSLSTPVSQDMQIRFI